MLTYSDCIVYIFPFFVSFLATVFDGEIKLYISDDQRLNAPVVVNRMRQPRLFLVHISRLRTMYVDTATSQTIGI